jgi:hypothetical protein
MDLNVNVRTLLILVRPFSDSSWSGSRAGPGKIHVEHFT